MPSLRAMVPCALLAALLAPLSVKGQEFKPLFNGRDLSGWVEMGKPGAFWVEEGMLILKAPQNHPNWLRSEKEYENFVLKLEYMMRNWCETGIFLNAPLYGDLARSGLRLHLRHDRTDEGSRSAGSIYDVAPPLAQVNNPANQWNSVEIHMDWPNLRVKLNNVLIQDLNLSLSDKLSWKARRGYLGLDDLNCGGIRYRNIQIHELPDKDRSWISLFNGKDLNGWTSQGKVKWFAEDGKIIGRDGDGFLFTEKSFGAFEFQIYFRTTTHANGGVLYRRTGSSNGYEIQIYNVPGATNPTGSIYGRVSASDIPCRDGEWCMMQLVSDGAYTSVRVNGNKVAESHGLTLPDQGQLGLQMHSEGQIEYALPRIRPLR